MNSMIGLLIPIVAAIILALGVFFVARFFGIYLSPVMKVLIVIVAIVAAVALSMFLGGSPLLMNGGSAMNDVAMSKELY